MILDPADRVDDLDFFLMDVFDHSTTGLSSVIYTTWKDQGGEPRIMVDMMDEDYFRFSVSICDEPRVVKGSSDGVEDLNKYFEWVKLNKDVLMAYWNFEISSFQLADRLRKINV